MKTYSMVVSTLSGCIFVVMQNVFKISPGISFGVGMALCSAALLAAGLCVHFARQTELPDNVPKSSVKAGRRQFMALVFGLTVASLAIPFIGSLLGPALSTRNWWMISTSTFGFSVVAAFLAMKVMSRVRPM